MKVSNGLFFIVFWGLAIISTLLSCAKRGSPTGGMRDTIAPEIVKESPKNFSTFFNNQSFEVSFDEYIKLKNIQENLIISPPLKFQPEITPLSTSKKLKVSFQDTLKPETTYSFSFGESIVDNNEENPFSYFKYVFSTGAYIDSLTLNGRIQDALLGNLKDPAVALLYELTDTYTDSLPLLEKPNYVAVVRDSTAQFAFTNLKAGTYRLFAIQESQTNYVFQPRQDKFGFYSGTITLPTDSTYTLSLFKELPEFKWKTPKHEAKQRITLAYQGQLPKPFNVNALTKSLNGKITKDLEKDSLYYWFKPPLDLETQDSLTLIANTPLISDTLHVRLRNLYNDSLVVTSLHKGVLSPSDTLRFTGSTPIERIDISKIALLEKDSIPTQFNISQDSFLNTFTLNFTPKETTRYTLSFLPDCVTDFFNQTNKDTLQFKYRTQAVSDYGSLQINLNNVATFPAIVQLVNTRFEVIKSQTLTENTPVLFSYINPATYQIRVIYDTNANSKWDTGNYLKNLQPESVVYAKEPITIRSNWAEVIQFNLE